MQNFLNDGEPEGDAPPNPVMVQFHDESIFYAHDCNHQTWYHKNAPAKPYTKGEGHSLMVAEYVSAKHNSLISRNGSQNA